MFIFRTLKNVPLTQASASCVSGDQGEPGAQGSVDLCEVYPEREKWWFSKSSIISGKITLCLSTLFSVP